MKRITLNWEHDLFLDEMLNLRDSKFTGILYIVGEGISFGNGGTSHSDVIYYLDGLYHREDGPAVTSTLDTGEEDHYYLNDEQYSRLDFYKKQYEKHKGTEIGERLMANFFGTEEK
jgi:hypothetical protein